MLVTFFHSEDVTPMKSGDFVCWVFLVVGGVKVFIWGVAFYLLFVPLRGTHLNCWKQHFLKRFCLLLKLFLF